jgi:hypothetical protein
MQSENNVFTFLLGWALMIVILMLVNKTRLGHVIIYYSLLLAILFILVIEYQSIAPLLTSLQSVGEFNAKNA